MPKSDEHKRGAGVFPAAAFSFVKKVGELLVFISTSIWRLFAWVAARLVGEIHWQAPGWSRWLASQAQRGADAGAGAVRQHPRATLITLAMMAGLAYGAWMGNAWWQARPKPLEVTFTVTSPARTEIELDDPSQRQPKPAVITFSHSVAPLAQVGKDVAAGVTLSPQAAGVWRWTSDRTLAFTPQDDWPVGTEYQVGFERRLFNPEVRLAQYSGKFGSAPFIVEISKAEFYQDPVKPALKKAVIDLHFTHPVNPVELEKRIGMKLAGQAAGVFGIGKETTRFVISYDKLKLNAYVHSEPLAIPKDSTTLEFSIAEGVSAARGGRPFELPRTAAITVPGLYSLQVKEVTPQVVSNERNEPEQVLLLQMSMPVHEREMQKSVTVWVLPKFHPDTKAADRIEDQPHAWSADQVTDAVLKVSGRLAPEAIPAEHEVGGLHSYRYRANVGANLYVRVAQGITSFGGYVLGKADARVLQVPPFPAELKILSEGALLALSGEKKVALLVRDLPGIKVEIGRVLPSQLQHLISQSSGSFTRPEFNDRFGRDNLTERFEQNIPLPHLTRGRAHYQAVDMGAYLKGDGAERRGVFLLSVTGYDPKLAARAEKLKAASARRPGEPAPDTGEASQQECESDCDAQESGANDEPPENRSDKRLVLVTDLGILVKKSMDGSQDVYVQSIYSGNPVDAATVEIIGKNGLVLFSQATDASGHARFAKIDSLTRERAPLMVVVRKGGDLSFMPLNKSERGLDMSRFDVGGARNAAVADQLSAHLFSDRGIYRPGDTFNIGMIVKPANWGTSLTGLPLELEILDARGLTLKREKIKLPADGFIEASYATQENAPTGTYSVNLHLVRDGQAGAQIGATSVKVQEFQPDRMKVSARFSGEASEGWVSPKGLKAHVNAQNLFGTPAESRRVSAEITLSPAFPAFRHYPDYKFYDPQRAPEGYAEKPGEQVTDGKGDAEFDLGLEKFARATYRVHLLARAFEPLGGRGVAAEAATLVSELPYLIGFKSDGPLEHVSRAARRTASIIAINPQAQRAAVGGLTLQLVERKYVSVLTRQKNDTYKYESRKKEILLREAPLALAAGGFQLVLATDTPGNFAYVIRDAQGLEFNRIEYAVAGKGNVTRSLERNAELQLTLNKKDYLPGEEIEIGIKAPYAGAGLITIERDKVFMHQWFKSDTLASVQKIRLPKDFEGNAYVSVQFIRDPGSDEIFMSPLSYGVVPFATSLATRTNKLTLTAPDLVKPGQPLKIKLSAAQPTRALVFAVDEGILQVARYQTPDPLALFFQKRMLEVRTAQILDLILPEFKKLMAASAPGGDAEGALGKHLNPFKRKRDKPVVYWSGIVDVKGEQEFTYQVPDYFNGTLRVMAVAVNDTTIGTAQAKSLVRGDFVLSPNLPLAVTPGDEFDVSVGVANNVARSGKEAPIVVTVQTTPHLQVIGEATRTLKIGEMREGVATYRLKAIDGGKAMLGSASVRFSASLDSRNARLATDVSVRPAVPRYTRLSVGNFTGTVDVPVTRDLYAEYRQLEAGVSPLPLLLAGGLSSYLADFSHLCTEQMVSQAVPALLLARRPEFGKSGTGLRTARGLDDAWRILRTRQNANGGFGLWSASVEADEFASVYAVHLMLEARDLEVAVPADMLQKGLAYLQKLATSPASELPALRARAYAAYLLTRQMVVTTPLLTGIRETLESRYPKDWQSDLAGAYLAASYQLQKQDRVASSLIDRQVERLVRAGAPVAYDRYYDSTIHDAQALYLLARHFPARAKALPPAVMSGLLKPIADGRVNTLSSAYLILALDAYANAVGPEALGKLSITEVDAKGGKKALALPANLMPRVAFSSGMSTLRFASDANLTSYYSVIESGFDKAVPTTELRAGMEVLREFTDQNGKPLTSIRVGDEVTVKLKFRAIDRSRVASAALVDLMPGGFEPVLDTPSEPAPRDNAAKATAPGTALAGLSGARSNWNFEYADVREDRVVFYGTVTQDFSEISYRIKATNSGRFIVPPAYGESMYDRTIQARAAGGQILTVEPPKTR